MKYALLFFTCLLMSAQAYGNCDVPEHMKVESFSFSFEDDEGVQQNVTVDLPNLAKAECRIMGDWGPNYYFEEKLEVTYTYETEEGNSEGVLNDYLTGHSTMKARERASWPHYFILADLDNRFKYYVKFHKKRGPDKVEVQAWSGGDWFTLANVKVKSRKFRKAKKK